MDIKIFDGKKTKIRKLSAKDIDKVKDFQDFINSLIKKGAKILMNKPVLLKNEKKWLEGELNNIKDRKAVFLYAQESDKIVGTTGINLRMGRENHVGNFGIAIRAGYRGIGLGNYLVGEIIKLAKKELKPKPRIVRLSVYPNNKPAINLYKKFGFKKVADIPKQVQYKGELISEVIMLRYL